MAIDIGIMMKVFKDAQDEDVQFEISTYQQIGKRPFQEDCYISVTIRRGHLLEVFDGHNGPWAAEKASILLPTIFNQRYDEEWKKVGSRDNITAKIERKIIRQVVNDLIEELKDHQDGTTLSMVYARPIGRDQSGQRKILVTAAVIGDSPLMVFSNKRTKIMPAHSAVTHLKDRKEIEEKGMCYFTKGYVWKNRDNGLALTRALGDSVFGEGLIRRADIKSFEVTSSDYAIIASDGVFTHKTFKSPLDEQLRISKLVRGGADAGEIGRSLGNTADNLTLSVMKFRGR